jgi:hemolysin D
MSRTAETAFLPAALELQEKPPSPTGRAIAWLILCVFVAGVAWSYLGQVDVVAVAQGRVIPNGYSKVVQAPETGPVAAIHVSEGDPVEAGDLLLELDAAKADADLAAAREERRVALVELERLEQLQQALAALAPGEWSAIRTEDPVARETWEAFGDRLRLLQRERTRQSAEHAGAQRQLGKLRALLPLVARMARDQKKLAEDKLAPEQQYLAAEQERLELEHDIRTQAARVDAGAALVAETVARIQLAISEFRHRLQEDLEKARHRLAVLEQAWVKAAASRAARDVRAPVTGVVQQLAVHSAGAVVTPAQNLMLIVPRDGSLEVEAMIANQDIGFVEVGQTVEVKIDTFPFTRYGTLRGTVSALSADAVADAQRNSGYTMRVTLDGQAIEVEGRQLPLVPGMTVTVETMTGQRRLIEFVLSPLMRHLDEAARER